MSNRNDFKRTVKPFFDKLRTFDPALHGKLADFVAGSYESCLANKSEYVDYSFVPEGIDPRKVKLKEDMLIATHAFRIVVAEVEECSDTDMVEIYNVFQNIGRKKGWSSLEFDKNCLNLMGIEVRRVKPPMYLPGVQMGTDYN